MKLLGFLKDKVDKAETKEEKKSIIAEAGMELTDDELESVAGGGPGFLILKCLNPSCYYSKHPYPSQMPGGNCPECGGRLVRM